MLHTLKDGRFLPYSLRRWLKSAERYRSTPLLEFAGQTVEQQKVEILKRVKPHFVSDSKADEWYSSEPLSGFAGQTAEQLVREGHAEEVIAYIDAVEAGVHA